jgi:hypothetical protein
MGVMVKTVVMACCQHGFLSTLQNLPKSVNVDGQIGKYDAEDSLGE